MGVHIVNRIVAVDHDANNTVSWFFRLHQADVSLSNDSPGWAPSAIKSLVDAAVNAQTRASFDNAVSSLLPSNTA
jgi:hypothetical protein